MTNSQIGKLLRLLLVGLALALPLPLRAEGGHFTDPLDGKLDFSGLLADHAYGFLPVPTISSTCGRMRPSAAITISAATPWSASTTGRRVSAC